MHIKELKLHNFRGIKDLHLRLSTNHNVCVLVGVNGVGKSSVLNCINLLVKYYDLTYEGRLLYHQEAFFLESDIHIGTDRTINQIQARFESDYDVEWSIAHYNNKDSQSWEQRLQESRTNILANIQTSLKNHYFYYLSNRQVLGSTLQSSMPESIIDFNNFSNWFKQTEDLENERRLSDNIDYRDPILTSVRRSIYSLLGEEYSNLAYKRKIDRMTIRKFDRETNIELLSDGEKSLLAMVGHLSRHLAEGSEHLDNPLEASALVLIDEIELHLHPAWQRMIIPRLTQIFPNCQFIVTTHSPQVLSHVDPECIHILDYDGDNIVVKRPENSYGLDSNRILEDILGVPKRPQEIQDRILELFRTINNNDLEQAKKIVEELGDRIGTSEPELVKAEATIKRREIIGR
jgi:predicted ATP-binding protein involved in virulence